MHFQLLFCFIHILIPLTLAKTKCFTVVGTFGCFNNPGAAHHLEVKLYDRDGRGILQNIDHHDLMGRTTSNELGEYKVHGCGYDFGPWNTPDPMLVVRHYCTGSGRMKESVIWLPKQFFPSVIAAGPLDLGDL